MLKPLFLMAATVLIVPIVVISSGDGPVPSSARGQVPPAPAVSTPARPTEAQLQKEAQDLDKAALPQLVKRWSQAIVDLPGTGPLVVPIEHFRSALGLATNSTPSRVGTGSATDLAGRTKSMNRHCGELIEAMHGLGLNHSTPELELHRNWDNAKMAFLSKLGDETETTRDAWKLLLTEWEVQVLRADPARFRDALLQAPVIIIGIALKLDDVHIETAARGRQRPAEIIILNGPQIELLRRETERLPPIPTENDENLSGSPKAAAATRPAARCRIFARR